MKDKELIETSNNENNSDNLSLSLEQINSKIMRLTKSVPELEHSKKMFGRTGSQYTSQLMSLTMLGDGPYHYIYYYFYPLVYSIPILLGYIPIFLQIILPWPVLQYWENNL